MKRVEVLIVIGIVLFTVAELDARKSCRNYRFGANIVAHFDPAKCHDLPEMRWTCNGVVFEPQEIRAVGTLEKVHTTENDLRWPLTKTR